MGQSDSSPLIGSDRPPAYGRGSFSFLVYFCDEGRVIVIFRGLPVRIRISLQGQWPRTLAHPRASLYHLVMVVVWLLVIAVAFASGG